MAFSTSTSTTSSHGSSIGQPRRRRRTVTTTKVGHTSNNIHASTTVDHRLAIGRGAATSLKFTAQRWNADKDGTSGTNKRRYNDDSGRRRFQMSALGASSSSSDDNNKKNQVSYPQRQSSSSYIEPPRVSAPPPPPPLKPVLKKKTSNISENDDDTSTQQQQQLEEMKHMLNQLHNENNLLKRQLAIQQKFLDKDSNNYFSTASNNHDVATAAAVMSDGSNQQQRPLLILESFEGDGSWATRENIFQTSTGSNHVIVAEGNSANIPINMTVGLLESMNGSNKRSASDIEDQQQQQCIAGALEEAYDDGTCPIEPNISFRDALRDRAYWLIGLLAMQSCSGFILARNELLLQDHPVIIYFLTMLVGAGGNAGNQASVRVIRGLALGSLNERTQGQFIRRELKMAFALSGILSIAGFVRAIVFRTPYAEAIAITTALLLIVFTSICLGAVLPLGLKRIGVDPAHSSTSIQVLMDILGVVMTVIVSSFMLDSPIGKYVISTLGGG